MKKVIFVLILVLAIHSAFWTVMADEADILILTEGRTNWNFTEEEVAEDDLTTILEAGVNTASEEEGNCEVQLWLILHRKR